MADEVVHMYNYNEDMTILLFRENRGEDPEEVIKSMQAEGRLSYIPKLEEEEKKVDSEDRDSASPSRKQQNELLQFHQ